MRQEDEVPDYLKDLPDPSEDVVWADLADRFEELSDMLRTLRVETKEQAIPQRHGMTAADKGIYWEDPEANGLVRSWLQIRYDPSRDEKHFREIWEAAQEIAARIEPKLKTRRLDVELMRDIAAFSNYAGIVEYEYTRNRPDIRHIKGQWKSNKEQHKRWYAHAFLKLRQPEDTRSTTDGRVVDLIYEILARNKFPDPDFPRKWFEEFFGGQSGQDLTRAFQQQKFSEAEIIQMGAMTIDDLPFRELILHTP